MPASRKRGGKKAHNKRIKARNEKLRGVQKKMRETYSKLLSEKLEDLQKKFSGESENQELTAQEIIDTLKVELPKPISTQE